MDLSRALHIFRVYCYRLEQDACDAESMLLTEEEKEAIRELRILIKERADLTCCGRTIFHGAD